ncbi:MAG: hypothetical protein JST45_04250 [Bacteroidetes bacterium]|nr:hypothetical protein [Bacteroidota bacterium]
MAYLNSIFQPVGGPGGPSVNDIYGNVQPEAHNGVVDAPEITDTRVRFEVESILFHQDDAGYYGNSPCMSCCQQCPDGGIGRCDNCAGCYTDVNYLLNNYAVDRCKYLNVFLIGRTCDLYGLVGGEATGSYVVMQNVWSSYTGHLPNTITTTYGGVSMPNVYGGDPASVHEIIAHELGHSLGFAHPWLQCSAFPDLTCSGEDANWCNPYENNNMSPECTNSVMGYSRTKTHWSPLQMGNMQQILMATLRSGWLTWETRDPSLDKTITTDETWSRARVMGGNITVEPGATLTIQCLVDMPTDGKIIVKQGARLIIDGGLINATSACDFWRGIEAWGTSNQDQGGYPIPNHQALVVLQNGGVIANAREGIQTMNPQDWNMIGGVVQVKGTPDQVGGTFWNCRRAVSYIAYQNTTPGGQPIANRSFFDYCDFIIDDNYRGGDDFYAHVSMWKVDGIRFRGCNFKNLQHTITESNKLGQGIISIDAQYSVTGACSSIQPLGMPCPEENLTRSTFKGLDHGIQASVSSTDRAFLVSDCDFTDNVVGVYSRSVNSFQVLKSNFSGGGKAVVPGGSLDQNVLSEGGHHGLFSTFGHGFRIEENHFTRSPDATNPFTGVRINFSGEYNSQVYGNEALNTNFGFVGEGVCKASASSAAYIGLQFLCDTNSNPAAQDIYDRKIGDPHILSEHGIRTQQGSYSRPAGNIFTQDVNVPQDESDFKNNTDYVLNYWYNNSSEPAAKPLDFTPGWVGIALTTHTNGCPSHLDGRQPQRYTEADMDAVRAEFVASKTAYVNTAFVFNALLDGGNTDALLQEVQLTWPQDAWLLHDELIAKSPYLSTEILREAVLKNIMPQAMLLEVLLANPDGTKKEGFIKWVQYEAPWPLPQYMIDLIVGSWNQRTFRTQLESDMGQHHADMSFAADEMISEWKNDTVSIRTDSILARWQQVPSLGARYSEALTHLERGEYNAANELLVGLETLYKLTTEQVKERNDAVSYITLLASANEAGHDLMHLDSAEVTALRNLAAEGCERPALWAQNILCFGYGECYSPCTGEGATQKSLRLPQSIPPHATPRFLSIYPNPATSYATLAYNLADAPKDAILVLRDLNGRELQRMPLSGKQGQQLLDTRSFVPGTYSVELLNDGVRIAAERLVLKP